MTSSSWWRLEINQDYDSQLAYASKLVFEASMSVATKLPGLSELKNETLWTIQTEILWTFAGFIIRDMNRLAGGSARDDIEEEVLPGVIQVMLERIFNWQEGTVPAQMEQHENFLYWFDEAEIGADQLTSFASPDETLEAMRNTSEIPNDSYVTKLCRRVAGLTVKDGASELIQTLARETAQAYESMGFAQIAVNLAEARQAGHATADEPKTS